MSRKLLVDAAASSTFWDRNAFISRAALSTQKGKGWQNFFERLSIGFHTSRYPGKQCLLARVHEIIGRRRSLLANVLVRVININKCTGNNVPADKLGIIWMDGYWWTWEDDPTRHYNLTGYSAVIWEGNWPRKKKNRSRSGRVATLRVVCWFDVRAELRGLYKGRYRPVWRVKFNDRVYGLQDVVFTASVLVRFTQKVGTTRLIFFSEICPALSRNPTETQYPPQMRPPRPLTPLHCRYQPRHLVTSQSITVARTLGCLSSCPFWK